MNTGLVDSWTIAHVAAGVAAGLLGVRFSSSMWGAAAYEIAEQAIERQPWGQRVFGSTGPEALRNVASDLAVFALGHVIGARLRTGVELGREVV